MLTGLAIGKQSTSFNIADTSHTRTVSDYLRSQTNVQHNPDYPIHEPVHPAWRRREWVPVGGESKKDGYQNTKRLREGKLWDGKLKRHKWREWRLAAVTGVTKRSTERLSCAKS